MWEQYNSGGRDFPTVVTLEFSQCTAVFSMALLSCNSSPQISGWLCFTPQAEYWSTHTFFPLPYTRQDPFSRALFLIHIYQGFHTRHQQRNLTGGFFLRNSTIHDIWQTQQNWTEIKNWFLEAHTTSDCQQQFWERTVVSEQTSSRCLCTRPHHLAVKL